MSSPSHLVEHAVGAALSTGAAWVVLGRAPWWPVAAVAIVAVAIVADLMGERGGRGRVSVAVGVGCVVAGAAIVVVGGLPTREEAAELSVGIAAALVGAIVTWRIADKARHASTATTSAGSLEGVVAQMARPVPVDELYQQVVDALRDTDRGRCVELWQARRGSLVLTHCRPLVDRAPVRLDTKVTAVAASGGIVGDSWLAVWMPDLLVDSGTDAIRIAPLAASGDLLGVLVLRRASDAPPFDADDDGRLAQVQRPVATAMNQSRLTHELGETVVALQQRNAELQESRARLVSVADAERRRLERDLHDGAQAHLTAIQAKLQVIALRAESAPEQVPDLVEQVRADLSTATAELRALAHGLVPPQLVAGGLGDALREAASRSPRHVTVDVSTRGRFRPEVEAAVYYCCVEALQNVVKHAGPGASAAVAVSADHDTLRFSVTDDGQGFAQERSGHGQGLVNMTDRIGALGGRLRVESVNGSGAAVTGDVPIAAGSAEVGAGDL